MQQRRWCEDECWRQYQCPLSNTVGSPAATILTLSLSRSQACNVPRVAHAGADVLAQTFWRRRDAAESAALLQAAAAITSDHRRWQQQPRARPVPLVTPVGERVGEERRRCAVVCVSFHKLSSLLPRGLSLIRLMRGFGGFARATSPFASMYPASVQTTWVHGSLRGQPVGPLSSERWDRGSSYQLNFYQQENDEQPELDRPVVALNACMVRVPPCLFYFCALGSNKAAQEQFHFERACVHGFGALFSRRPA